MGTPRFRGLRTYLFVLVAAAALPALGLILFRDHELRQIVRAEVRDDVLQIARVAAHDHELLIGQARAVLGVLARLPEVRARDRRRCSAVFASLLPHYPAHENFAAFTPRGDLFCTGVAPPGPVNASDRAFFQGVLRTRRFVVAELTQSRIVGKSVLVTAGPVLGERGRIVAVIATGLSLDWLAGLARRVELPPGSAFTLVDAAGTVVARHPDPERWVGQSVADRAPFKALLARPGEHTSDEPGLDGGPRVWAFKSLDVPDTATGPLVAVGVTRVVAFAEADRIVRRNLIALGAVVGGVLGVGWLGIHLVIVRPSGGLVGAARRLAAGDLGARSGPPHGPAEIGELGRAFDEMAAALEHRTLAIEGLSSEAEHRRRELESLVGTARTMTRNLDISTVSSAIVEGVLAVFGAHLSGLRLHARDGSLELVAASGSDLPVGHRLAPGTGIAGKAFVAGSAVTVDDYLSSPELVIPEDLRQAAARISIRGGAAAPLRVGDQVIGALTVGFSHPHRFDASETGLLQAFADQAAVAIQNARLFERVHQASERLGTLSRRLLEVQEDERRRLARELHDEVGQALTAVKMNLQMLGRGPEAGSDATLVGDTLMVVDRALENVRDLSLALRPSVLDDLGLAPALRWHVVREAERAGLEAELALDVPAHRPSPAVETACFRLVQEALTNVVRHAGARRVRVELRVGDGELVVTVQDDGVGFDVEGARRAARQGRSLGLLGMEERVALAGSRVEIESTRGKGTVIRARLPLTATGPPP